MTATINLDMFSFQFAESRFQAESSMGHHIYFEFSPIQNLKLLY